VIAQPIGGEEHRAAFLAVNALQADDVFPKVAFFVEQWARNVETYVAQTAYRHYGSPPSGFAETLHDAGI
jgi:hypothetical protein